MTPGKKLISKIGMINIEDIYLQSIMPNRDMEKVVTSRPHLKMLQAIKSTSGVINPIVVCADKNGKYELIAGLQRYLAYRDLVIGGKEGYKSILARVLPPETANKVKAKYRIQENKFRTNLDSMESIEQELAAVPAYLDCEVNNDPAINSKKGYRILKLYLSSIRNLKDDKYMQTIIEETGCLNAKKELRHFFYDIGESERSFFDKAREVMEASPEMYDLLKDKLVSLRHAKFIRNLKSNEDRLKIIHKLQNDKVPYKEIDKLIRESRRKQNPANNKDEIYKQVDNISSLVMNLTEDITENQYQILKEYLILVERTLKIKKV